jgi:hypothetical protein
MEIYRWCLVSFWSILGVMKLILRLPSFEYDSELPITEDWLNMSIVVMLGMDREGVGMGTVF